MNYRIHYEADGKVGARWIEAPNQGTAESRLIKRLKREGKKDIVITAVSSGE